MTGAHADAVLAIHSAGIEEGNATFEPPRFLIMTAASRNATATVPTSTPRHR